MFSVIKFYDGNVLWNNNHINKGDNNGINIYVPVIYFITVIISNLTLHFHMGIIIHDSQK